MKRILPLFLLLFAFIHAAPGPATTGTDEMAYQITDTLSTKLRSPHRELLSQIYAKNKNHPFWVGGQNSQRFSRLLGVLENPLYNYKHKSFNLKTIKRLSYAIDSGSIPPSNIIRAKARLDVLMSDALMQLIHFVRIGDVDWNLVQRKLARLKETQDVHAIWEIKPKKMPPLKNLYEVMKHGDLDAFMQRQLPLEKRYRNLVSMLQKYRKMPDYPKLYQGRRLKLGSSGGRIPQIKRMLKFFGDYPRSAPIDSSFDRRLAQAVRTFRERFKLPPGESIDNKMIHYLNTPKKEYLQKILVNLDKIKLYPRSFEKEYIEVNVPEYKMRFYRNGRSIFGSNIVVGRIDRPTPIFDSRMTYMVLNPTWTIPDNLVRRDLIPMLKKNPNYLVEHNIHVYTSYKPNAPEVELDYQKLFGYEHSKRAIPYRFVQFPSESNALGRVKFMFPNKYAVYLHDTDNKKLFDYRYRVFSSGCVRVERPMDFMQLLLRLAGGGYNEEKIRQILESNKPTTIRFKRPIPVHMVYFTVRREGKKDYFFYDIYLHDQIIWESTPGHMKPTFKVPSKRLDPLRKPKKKRRMFEGF